MESGNLISQSESRLDFRKYGIYQQYFNKTWGIAISVVNIPLAITICSIQLTLIANLIGLYGDHINRPVSVFQYSGIGIVAAVTSIITVVTTVKTSRKPTYAKILSTFLAHAVMFILHVGLVMFAISSGISPLNYMKWSSLECDCVDANGNIERNGTGQRNYNCVHPDEWNPILKCTVVDKIQADVKWEMSLYFTMITTAVIQAILSIVPILMSLRTFYRMQDTFDKKANIARTVEGTTTISGTQPSNAYHKYFSLSSARTMGWIQLGFVGLNFIQMISIRPREALPWHLVQLFATGSYVLLNWITTPGNQFTYFKLAIVAVFHLVATSIMFTTLVLTIGLFAWNEAQSAYYPMAILEIIATSAVFLMIIRTFQKVDKLS